MKTLKDFNFNGKKVIVRVDYNVPLTDDGEILEDLRIRESLETINYLINYGAKIALLTHFGRPDGKRDLGLTTEKIARRLGSLLHRDVFYVDSCVGEKVKKKVESLKSGEILMLENVRFYAEEESKNKSEREKFAKDMASYFNLYVNDAFGNCHRDHASMTGLPKFLDGCIGSLVEKEYKTITNAMNSPKIPFVSIIGGVKADKLNVIDNLLKKCNNVLLGGALALLFLKAKGYDIGKSKIDMEGFNQSNVVICNMLNNKKLILPLDLVTAKDIKSKEIKVVDADKIPKDHMALDIGAKTIQKYIEILKSAKTIIWNGPLGAYEYDNFINGTKKVAEFVANSDAVTIVGGGDSSGALEKLNLSDKFSHVSTGGGASLKLFAGEKLVALEALR